MGELFEDDLLNAVGRCVLADDGNGLGNILPRFSEDLTQNGVPFIFGLPLGVVDNELDVHLGVFVAGGLFGLGRAALYLLLVHLCRLRDLDTFYKAREDDPVQLNALVLNEDHGRPPFPYAGLGVASGSLSPLPSL